MNAAIQKELDQFNEAPFQKRDGSRHSVFLEEEFPFLQPLPRYPYKFAQWKSATAQLNYHIAIDFQNYSVPYEYVHKKVDVRYTKSSIEVYYKENRICSHKRLYGRRGQYSTIPDHMPVNLIPTGLKNRLISVVCLSLNWLINILWKDWDRPVKWRRSVFPIHDKKYPSDPRSRS